MHRSILAFLTCAVQALAAPDVLLYPRATNTMVLGASSFTANAPTSVTTSDYISKGVLNLPTKPSECTSSANTYQTSAWVHAQDVVVFDALGPGLNWWGSSGTWTFSTNTSNVVFGPPDPTDLRMKPRKSRSSFTLESQGLGAGTNSSFKFYVYNHNGSLNDTQLCQKLPTETNDQPFPWEHVNFYLAVTGTVPCDHPTGNSSCSTNTIKRTSDQWGAYGVDRWFGDWLSVKIFEEKIKNASLLQTFVSQFNIGSGKSCTIEDPCQLIDTCENLPNEGKDNNSPQIYLALIAMQNISDMLHKIWISLNIGETDTMTQVAEIALKFHSIDPVEQPKPHSPLGLLSGVLGTISGLAGMIPFERPVSAFAGLLSGVAGIANTEVSKKASSALPDMQYTANQAETSNYLGDYVKAVRSSVEQLYSDIFNLDVDSEPELKIYKMMLNGAAVNRTDLNIDCSDCVTHNEGWMEQFLTLKMINWIWRQQSAFITFMPYGTVVQVDTGEETTFDESACVNNFLKTEEDKLLTICHTDDFGWGDYLRAGMARLNWYNPKDPKTVKMDKNGYGILDLSHGPPGYNSTDAVLNTTGVGSYTFKAVDAVESSLRGFVKGGFDYEGVGQNGVSHDPDQALDQLSDIYNMSATSAGMFNIPVCTLSNLNYWPTFWSSNKGKRLGGDYYSPCQGTTDRNGEKFEDHVSPDLKKVLTTIFAKHGNDESVGPGDIRGPQP